MGKGNPSFTMYYLFPAIKIKSNCYQKPGFFHHCTDVYQFMIKSRVAADNIVSLEAIYDALII